MTGKELKRIIEDRGIKQIWIAEKLKISPGLVNQWINSGKTISDSHKIELKSLLGV